MTTIDDVMKECNERHCIFGRCAGINVYKEAELKRMIADGLPTRVFDQLKRSMRVKTSDLVGWMGISSSTLRVRRKNGMFSPKESERLAIIAMVFDKAEVFLGSRARARKWVFKPVKVLRFSPFGICKLDPLSDALGS